MALFGSSGMLTAALAGGKAAIMLGNLALLAAAGALVLGTLVLKSRSMYAPYHPFNSRSF